MDLELDGLAGLGAKKEKKKYKNLMIEGDTADEFRVIAKKLNVTQTKLLVYMMDALKREAQIAKDARASK